jgi:hypothetical protein
MKTFSTGSGFEDADDENVDASSLENQGQPVIPFKLHFFFHRSNSTEMIEAANNFREKFGANGKKNYR